MAGQTIQISVLADTKQFTGAMKGLGDSVGQFGKTFAGIGKTVATGMGLAVGALAAVGLKDFIGEAIAASDATDKFKQTLAFAGIKPQGIEALAKSTKAYADQTVYNLGDIQNVTAQLAANAVPNYDKLAQAAGNLNAVAGGNAETFKSVGMVLTQTAGAGKLTTENWNQMADAIPGASGILQEALRKNGAFTGNFRDAMAKGQITAAEFNTALMQLGMDETAQKAATSTKTFEGAWGSLQATITGGIADILSVIKPFATEFMANTAKVIGPALEQIKTVIQNNVLPALQGFGQWFTNEGLPALQGFGEWVEQNILPSLQGFADWFTATGTPAVSDFGNFFKDTLVPAFEDLGRFIANDVMPALNGFGDWLKENKDILLAVGAAILAAAAAFGIWQGALAAYAVVQNIANAAQAAWNVISKANPIMLIVMAVMALAAGLIYFFTQTETGKKMWKTFTDALKTAWDATVKFFNDTLNNVKKWFSDAGNKIKSDWEAVSKFFGELPGKIKQFFADAANWLLTRGKEVLAGLKKGAEDGWNGLSAWFKDIPNKLRGFLSNAGDTLLGIGKAIIDGFLRGLKDSWKGVTDFVGGIAGWIRDNKGPISYDRTLLKPAGQAIMGGFLGALKDGYSEVQSFVGGIGTDIAGGINTAFDAESVAARGGTVYVINGLELPSNPRLDEAFEVLTQEIEHYAGVGI